MNDATNQEIVNPSVELDDNLFDSGGSTIPAPEPAPPENTDADSDGEPAADSDGAPDPTPEPDTDGAPDDATPPADEPPAVGADDEPAPDGDDAETFSQRQVNSIVNNRLDQERVKYGRMEAEMRQRDQRIQELEAHAAKVAEQQAALHHRLKDDTYLDEEAKKLLDVPKVPQAAAPAGGAMHYADLNLQQFELDGAELVLSMREQYKERGDILAQRVNLLIQSGSVPQDIVTAAVNHKNGVGLLEQITRDEGLKNQLTLAMYNSDTHAGFRLKFNEIADSIDKATKTSNLGQPGGKPKPIAKEPLKPAGGATVTETDVVYVD